MAQAKHSSFKRGMPPQHRRDRVKARLKPSKENTEPCNVMSISCHHQISIGLGSPTSPTVTCSILGLPLEPAPLSSYNFLVTLPHTSVISDILESL